LSLWNSAEVRQVAETLTCLTNFTILYHAVVPVSCNGFSAFTPCKLYRWI